MLLINNEVQYLIISIVYSFLVQHLNIRGIKLVRKKFLYFILVIFLSLSVVGGISFLPTVFVDYFHSRVPLDQLNSVTTFIKVIIILISLIISVMKFYKFKLVESIGISIISYMVVIVGELFATLILIFVFNKNVAYYLSNIAVHYFMHIIIVLFSFIVILLKPKIFQIIISLRSRIKLKIKSSVIYVLYFCISIIVVALNVVIYDKFVLTPAEKQITLIYSSFFIIFIIITGFIIYFNNVNIKQEISQKEKDEQYQQLIAYTNIIEDLSKGLKKQQHDYGNIFLSLAGYIEKKNIEKLSDYFFREVMSSHSNFDINKESFFQLNFIENAGLKGLITAKINQALNLKLNVEIDIFENISDFYIENYDLFKILGILIDNAIEAASSSEKKIINLVFIKHENMINMLIGNTYKEAPALNKIFELGYSSKGNERGIGLDNIMSLIDSKYENVLISTSIEDELFIQDLKLFSPELNINNFTIVNNYL